MNRFSIVVVVLLCAAGSARALETERIDLRHGPDADGAVSILRDIQGNLVFEDQFTTPTTLRTLADRSSRHDELLGLENDDHPQYLTAARHDDVHDAAFNNALAISGGVGENETLGDHVADTAIHLRRGVAESIGGAWDFAAGVRVGGGLLRLGASQFGSDAAIRFADTPSDAELRYHSAPGRFEADRPMSIPALEFPGVYTIAVVARNGGGAIEAGEAVIWTGLDGALPMVVLLDSAMEPDTPLAGIVMEGASTNDAVRIAVSGTPRVKLSDAVTAGDALTWTGTGAAPAGGANSTAAIGIALENGSSGALVRMAMQRFVVE